MDRATKLIHMVESGATIDLVVGFLRGHKDAALNAIQVMDPKVEVDPEGNPAVAWIRTHLSLEDILDVEGVEDAVEAKGFKSSRSNS